MNNVTYDRLLRSFRALARLPAASLYSSRSTLEGGSGNVRLCGTVTPSH
ncbi:MAG: hypothetical protein J6X56_08525 [Ruminococcus sp.]|nr:hypothetical protein [Ruminococcus sp.]MBP5579502.1 hypothetical protein [Ruminococcus sp.]